MNLFKIYSALAIVLVMCTYNAEGGIILLLLLKIIALKGALFFGMPLAIGSFMMGQGMGFFGGSLFGGYSMLNAAHKYHSGKGLGHKHKGLFHKHHHKGVHHVHTTYPVHVVPSHGWGWGSRLATERPGWKAPAPSVHYHSYGYTEHKAQPSLLSKITSFPARLVNRFKPKPAIVSEYGDLGWSSNTPVVKETVGAGYADGNGWSSAQPAASVLSHASSYGKNPGLHTYYDDANAGNEYGGTAGKAPSTSNMDDVDWSQGLANLLKAAEAQAEAEAANAPASAYKDTYEQSQSPQQSYGSPSSSHYDGTSASGSSGYQNSQPEAGGYASGSETGAGADTGSKTLIAGYTDNAQQGYYDPGAANSYYDRDGLASEEVPSVTSAPNSVIERFLESKLRAEMEKQKNVAEKKETAQLISMLRQVYIQELVDSLDGDTTGKRGVRMAVTTTELPEFIPFPGVPNSTTAKPKTIEVTSLKSEAPASTTDNAENASSRSTSVESPPTSESASASVAKSPFVRAHQNGYLVGGDTDDVQGSIASSSSKSADDDEDEEGEEPTRFVPMKTTWTLTRRQLLQARVRRRRQELLNQRLRSNAAAASNYNILADTVRTRRQTGAGAGGMDAAALSTFTDDVKKFFLLVSILDQDKCLQKLVCDVHTRGPGAQLTTYESNILVTFKVMNVLLPGNSEDATTNYRKAAKIGELSKAAAVCAKAYPTCSYSVSQIISMGNQVAETGNVDSASKITSKVDDATQTDTETDMETGASGVQIKTVSATDDQATAMPRV